jgi:hypothetical protein
MGHFQETPHLKKKSTVSQLLNKAVYWNSGIMSFNFWETKIQENSDLFRYFYLFRMWVYIF